MTREQAFREAFARARAGLLVVRNKGSVTVRPAITPKRIRLTHAK